MIVSELVEALQKMPQDLKVWFSTAYDSDEVSRIQKVDGKEVYGAEKGKEVIEIIYW